MVVSSRFASGGTLGIFIGSWRRAAWSVTSARRASFVGDSSNDVWIARTAGFAVAFNPRSDELERIAGAVVRSDDMRDVLPHLLER